MRVISGTMRGKKLKSPKDSSIRPTADRVKESLFNILGRRVYGCRFADLFCGSGAIGIEAISRGAEQTVFVDCDVKLTEENLCSCRFDKSKYKVLQSDIRNFIKTAKQSDLCFDILFMDPPYGFQQHQALIEEILFRGLLTQEGLLIVETETKEPLPQEIGGWKKYDERVCSITKLSFYEGKKIGD